MGDSMRDLTTARSLLFVPGTRPERFRKAAEAGADGIVLDLEDAVAPADKSEARSHVDGWLGDGNVGVVRVNARDTDWHAQDLDMVRRHGCPVMIPKVESVTDVEVVWRHLRDDADLIPLIESSAAVLAAREICSGIGVTRVAFGSFDLGAEIGVAPERQEAFLFARSALVLACASAKIAPPLDGVTGDVSSPDALRADIEHASGLGFGGKLCIHPKQVAAVNAGFAPDESEVRWAYRILAEVNDQGVAVVDGKMIDAPVIARARRILKTAGITV
ncbi:CoA ester lyase [Mycolicibacterium peregrinum]|uniref:CoA ester lyase n=3 Tax=Mycobacteriaceae TaxID=1762 RepID=A0A4Z0HZ48_MYCPR|nr:CoA ester lyase [Mycolicibacterium porcinum]ORB34819.1 CoA ester lyase [Mycolicibacterium porcinum]TGB45499.1 CoA ester lyase [Mycolicibacterium peregrinum]TGB47771.1 CoA ester lyase [Mycolicibacterium peregrinum]